MRLNIERNSKKRAMYKQEDIEEFYKNKLALMRSVIFIK